MIGVALVVSKVVVFGSAVDCGKKVRPKLQVWLFLPRAVEEPYKGVNNGDECLISAVFVRDDVVVMKVLVEEVVQTVRRVPGKRSRDEICMVVTELSQDKLMRNLSCEDQVKATGIAFEPAHQIMVGDYVQITQALFKNSELDEAEFSNNVPLSSVIS
ncbi:hypothetical protein Tco_1261991 [Tanacetum coccineum]